MDKNILRTQIGTKVKEFSKTLPNGKNFTTSGGTTVSTTIIHEWGHNITIGWYNAEEIVYIMQITNKIIKEIKRV